MVSLATLQVPSTPLKMPDLLIVSGFRKYEMNGVCDNILVNEFILVVVKAGHPYPLK